MGFIFADYQIKTVPGGKCFDAGANMTAGTTITLSDCDGSPQQQFGFDSKMGAIYLIKSREEDASMCLDLAGGKATVGTVVQVWGCNGLWNQKWSVTPSPTPSPPTPPAPGQEVQIRSLFDKQDAMCVGLYNVGHHFVEYRVELFKCVDEPTEKFIFADYQISFGKLCFDAGSNMTAGTTITLSDCDGSPQQQFGFDSKMGAIYLIKSREEDAYMCLDLTGEKATVGTVVQVWGCNGLVNQKWSVTPSPTPPPPTPPAPGQEVQIRSLMVDKQDA